MNSPNAPDPASSKKPSSTISRFGAPEALPPPVFGAERGVAPDDEVEPRRWVGLVVGRPDDLPAALLGDGLVVLGMGMGPVVVGLAVLVVGLVVGLTTLGLTVARLVVGLAVGLWVRLGVGLRVLALELLAATEVGTGWPDPPDVVGRVVGGVVGGAGLDDDAVGDVVALPLPSAPACEMQ